ncbi:ATP phosphoribosyltransferase [Dehalogenimonas alkenigignens]|uniref:ATP phosphoribosyltransferase n=1 Tax=Dehalogenimonas alkenigignens TaxID=1217799 RepID=A0A0W0GJF8_9CHLR|nr:ATP phosphoribosyltransferase [Dehalogenimonas alkenigignens]KTB48697.1 ATP phosphoribosyltransferase [Dehalogenimonas alkenigignens]PVV84885.1 ATP phosphoribosyltransferase [Dehalogenimonas alkenigignens]
MRVALPKGRLLSDTAALLDRAGWQLNDYQPKARLYRLTSAKYPELSAKMLHEKDIPIQVAIGNYDLGICGADWVEELVSRYRLSSLVKVRVLGYGHGALYAASAAGDGIASLADLSRRTDKVRLASEYPNLAEQLAIQLRLKNYAVYPLWGSAEAYPPETAEVVILPRKSAGELISKGLKVLSKVLDFKAVLIANRESLASKDLSAAISSILANLPPAVELNEDAPPKTAAALEAYHEYAPDVVRLALPDGHQQPHVRKILDAAGIGIEDYPSDRGFRRPKSDLEGFAIKTIRPQDMPIQVANGNFDLAITGWDWLTDHLHQFPASPVKRLLDLKYGWVRIVAVVANEVPVTNAAELKEHFRNRNLRVASEYINIADEYARNNHFGRYRIAPTWGSTEAYLPEDADLLIENTETGGTIARHNLRIIDTLFESTACVIGNTRAADNPVKRKRMEALVERLGKALDQAK